MNISEEVVGLHYTKEKRLKIKDEVIEMEIYQKGRKLMLRKILINIKICLMINLFFNCLSINYLKLDEKKFEPKENVILYKIEEKQ